MTRKTSIKDKIKALNAAHDYISRGGAEPGRRIMKRYIIEVYVRPEGSLGVFDPSMITVDAATDDATALAVAAAVADERGWEIDPERSRIVHRELV